jgi:hypothetical protein
MISLWGKFGETGERAAGAAARTTADPGTRRGSGKDPDLSAAAGKCGRLRSK